MGILTQIAKRIKPPAPNKKATVKKKPPTVYKIPEGVKANSAKGRAINKIISIHRKAKAEGGNPETARSAMRLLNKINKQALTAQQIAKATAAIPVKPSKARPTDRMAGTKRPKKAGGIVKRGMGSQVLKKAIKPKKFPIAEGIESKMPAGKALNKLIKLSREAKKRGDTEAVKAIDKRIADINKRFDIETGKVTSTTPPPKKSVPGPTGGRYAGRSVPSRQAFGRKSGGKVFRRGGGQALRGFGKATYSNKMY
tara:strand:+ start:85 stop:846 length:762 start_codon:yes stop_codon:yes gene_type:complete